MANRLELDAKLREILGSNNMYFQPPESIKLQYPCIIYEMSDIPIEHADDGLYMMYHRYTITLIHTDPDNTLKDEILAKLQPYCSFDRDYISSNLYHYVYNLFY